MGGPECVEEPSVATVEPLNDAAAIVEEVTEIRREFLRSASIDVSLVERSQGQAVSSTPETQGDANDQQYPSRGSDDKSHQSHDMQSPSRGSSDKSHQSHDVPAPVHDCASEPQQDVGEAEAEETDGVDRHFVAPKDFELLKVIGMGAFGKVLQVRHRQNSKIFAMKVISKRIIKRKISYVDNILAERNILSKIANHPFIVTMYASFQTREKLFIVMDFAAGGELFQKLGMEGHFLERTAAFYLAEMTLALEHLHSINVLHRDLKPENILLQSDGHCCLTDFGLAKEGSSEDEHEDAWARTLCGTMEYMAPEMVARKWYGKGADYWSLGCIAYEMLSGLPPFSSKKGSKELFRLIMQSRIRMPDGASASACKLLKGLLNRDVGKRLGASRGTMFEVGGVGALKQQPFFNGLDWGKLELKEVEPPEDFSVDNDEDLRHFHEEFTKMNLPRSVKEMSKLDFLPRRCESDNFRGFSFIGEKFQLPERTASEKEHYWNNVDEDGASLSECASSVFDEDLMETSAPEPIPEPKKKKRPPRKKKKKQAQVPLETTDEGCENKKGNDGVGTKGPRNGTVAPKTDGTAAAEPEIVKPDGVDRSAESRNEAVEEPVSKEMPQATLKYLNPNAKAWSTVDEPGPPAKAQSASSPDASAPAQQQTKPNTWASLAVGEKTPKPAAAQSTPRPAPPPAKSSGGWATVGKPGGQSGTGRGGGGGWSTVRTDRAAPPRVATRPPQSRERPAGGWSTVGNGGRAAPARREQRRQAPGGTAAPLSPDWTSHAMSPRKSPSSAARNVPSARGIPANAAAGGKPGAIPPPPLDGGGPSWPSLGDFPPPPGGTGGKPRRQQQQAKPAGSWGKPVQAKKKSAWGA